MVVVNIYQKYVYYKKKRELSRKKILKMLILEYMLLLIKMRSCPEKGF